MKLLIPLAYLNEACFLSSNIDEKKFKMMLKLAQETLRDLLGGEYYSEIETQYSPTADTFTTDNATLYEDYIKDFLAWQTYYNLLGFSQSESTPTGMRQFKDDNSTILEDVKLFSLEKNILNWVNHYRYKLLDFLKLSQDQTSTKYPLYKQRCHEEFSFGFSSIKKDRQAQNIISISKAVRANE